MSTTVNGPSNNGARPQSWSQSWTHFSVDRRSLGYCRVTFDHPPINTITATTVAELAELVGLIEQDSDLNVVVFDSANPDFYLAHYDIENDPGATAALGIGPTGLSAWNDVLVRLARAPIVSIAAIRGRARGAGSEFVLACDLRFASHEHTLLGQWEVGIGIVPAGGPMARLSRLVGRGRALEILLVADDLDGPRAERYGYVNRAVADDRLDGEVEAIAVRLARFDHEAIARTKSYVDLTTLPSNSELTPPVTTSASCSGGQRNRRSGRGSNSWGSTRTATSNGPSGSVWSTPCQTSTPDARQDGRGDQVGSWSALRVVVAPDAQRVPEPFREVMPSFAKTLWRCHSTVRALMNSSVAISELVRPSRANRAMCPSCGRQGVLRVDVRGRIATPVAASSRRVRSANASRRSR
jgi:enoyl-CoA hydratase/carnithine racemase